MFYFHHHITEKFHHNNRNSPPNMNSILPSCSLSSHTSSSQPFPKLGFLASYNGSSMQAIVREISAGNFPAIAHRVVSNNANSPSLCFAHNHNIPAYHISRSTHGDDQGVDIALIEIFNECDWVILSGYMRPIGTLMLQRFPRKILNIHPSLLPNFSGKGMYGRKIHEAVISSGTPYTGITIHRVNARYDEGEILAQLPIPVDTTDTVDSLEAKIKTAEPQFFVDTLRHLCFTS